MEDTYEILLRALIIYICGFILLRFSHRRLLGRESPFDILLGFIIGSTLSRGINGKAAVFDTLAAVVLLILLHSLLSIISFYFPLLSKALKGRSNVILKDGLIQWQEMRKHHLTEDDLKEELRLHAHINETNQVKLAQIEPNGSISVIPEKKSPKIIEVSIEAGVKTVRLQLE